MSRLDQVESFKKNGDLPSFLDQLQAYITLNDIAETKKESLLLTLLSPEVYKELKLKCEPIALINFKYDDLKQKLNDLYNPDKGEYLSRFTFRERKQKLDESVQEYLSVLKSLAQKCKFSAMEMDN